VSQPTPADAKARRLVALPDGRVGHLLYAPAPQRRDRTRAKVVVAGRHLHVEASTLRVLEHQP